MDKFDIKTNLTQPVQRLLGLLLLVILTYGNIWWTKPSGDLQHPRDDVKSDKQLEEHHDDASKLIENLTGQKERIDTSPAILPLLTWERESASPARTCNPPPGIPTTCCLGSYSGGGGVILSPRTAICQHQSTTKCKNIHRHI
jgi:hypothetical protein